MKDRFGFDEQKAAGTPFWAKPLLGRRLFFRHVASAVGGYMLLPGSSPMETVARAAVKPLGTAQNCIFILLAGAPSHTDTFDLKPDTNGMPAQQFGPTPYKGVLFPQLLLPRLAAQFDSFALVRSARAWANVHGLMQAWVQIGRNPAAPMARLSPHIGSVVSHELAAKSDVLPTFVVLGGTPSATSGFLSAANSPFVLLNPATGLPNTAHRDGPDRFRTRTALLRESEAAGPQVSEVGTAVDEASEWKLRSQLLVYNNQVDRIFQLDEGSRSAYGRSRFGDLCLAAHNLLRANLGTRFIQITFGDWDHHNNIYPRMIPMARDLDNGLGQLLTDLRSSGLLDETLIIVQGEFGRTVGPLNGAAGRDHYQQQSILFAGARIKGGRAIGRTDERGAFTVDPGWSRNRDVRSEDIEATIYSALGIDWTSTLADARFGGRGFEYVPSSDDVYSPLNELWE